MATPLSGYFEQPSQKQGRGATFVENTAYALMGRLPERLDQRKQEQQTLELNRQKAMAQDAMQVYNLLGSGRYDQAIDLIDKRVKNISELGGDPSDTLEIRQLITSGQVPVAVQELEGFLGQAMQYGLIEPPQAPEFLEMRDGQAIMKNPDGSISAQVPRGYTPPEAGSGANMGLSPVWLQNEQGQYVPAQLSSAGGMTPLEVPQGMRAIPPSGQLGFDPNAIAMRGTAETGVQVGREQALRPEVAQTAGAVTQAQEQARIESIMPRSEAERQAQLAASQGQRTGSLQQSTQQLQLVNELLDEAADNAGMLTTGIGSVTRVVPGTPAADMSARLDTIRANIGFDKLQDLRANSPTGGALGAVSDRENQLLQSVFGSLEQAQSQAQFLRNVERVRNQVQESWNRIDEAHRRDYGVGYFEAEQAAQRLLEAEDLFSQADAILRGSGL